ncbi:hypothetical protein K2224_14980 [Streptomyces sp. BHT-5-2]|uniref:hypothetical protein n=1 Tax=Streptomyces sp. BHT-5-2 TaxID=2866715 RepID=UPI001C8D8867|nr:hypothetical protein [Streptomyces sp. BHT-5-2]QZL04320.1 hypothetical protein K2224_14980 [Streptomyces sp. BHT-5-2]
MRRRDRHRAIGQRRAAFVDEPRQRKLLKTAMIEKLTLGVAHEHANFPVLDRVAGGFLVADAVGYRPPPPGAVAEAPLNAADPPICRVELSALADAIDIVNAYAETAHTVADLTELRDAATAASLKRWGRAPWCCSPDPDPDAEQTEAEPDIAAEWAAAGGHYR